MKFRIMCFAPGRTTPGMTLATAVIDRDGHTTLLTEGTVLDEEMLARLIHRGVETISVWLCSRSLWLSMASHGQGQPLSGFQTKG